MGRSTRVVGFSVAPKIAREVERLAKIEKTTKSELFRRMVESYRSQLEERELRKLQTRVIKTAGRAYSEEEIDRIVYEFRHGG